MAPHMHSLPHYQHPQLDGTFVQTDEPTLTQCCQPKPTAHGRLRFQRVLRGCAQLCNDRCPSSHTQSSSTALKILFVVYSPITASHPWEPHTHPTHTQLTQTHTLMHPVTQVHTLTYTLTLTLMGRWLKSLRPTLSPRCPCLIQKILLPNTPFPLKIWLYAEKWSHFSFTLGSWRDSVIKPQLIPNSWEYTSS